MMKANAAGERFVSFARVMGPLLPPPQLLQPAFGHVIKSLARRHPGIFERLGPYTYRTFLIDPTDVPYTLRLAPRHPTPRLELFFRSNSPPCHATISAPLSRLISLVESDEDGDALFFSRDVTISGDTEAIVALRNAIDDAEINLMEEFEAAAGPLQIPLHNVRKAVNVASKLYNYIQSKSGKSQ